MRMVMRTIAGMTRRSPKPRRARNRTSNIVIVVIRGETVCDLERDDLIL